MSIVDDRFHYRDIRNNNSIHAGFDEGLQPFLISCIDVAGITGKLSMYPSIIFARSLESAGP